MDMLPVHLRDTTHAQMHSSSQSKSSFKLGRLSLIVCVSVCVLTIWETVVRVHRLFGHL